MPIDIELGGRPITDCERKLSQFIAGDTYDLYDRQGVRAESRPDIISRDQLRLMNAAKRGRASARALQPFLDTPLPELARIPTTVAVSRSPEAALAAGLNRNWTSACSDNHRVTRAW